MSVVRGHTNGTVEIAVDTVQMDDGFNMVEWSFSYRLTAVTSGQQAVCWQ